MSCTPSMQMYLSMLADLGCWWQFLLPWLCGDRLFLVLLDFFFALCFSPFIFNPHNFCLQEYILDYGFFLGWLLVGTTAPLTIRGFAFKTPTGEVYRVQTEQESNLRFYNRSSGIQLTVGKQVGRGWNFVVSGLLIFASLFIHNSTIRSSRTSVCWSYNKNRVLGLATQ